MGNKNQNTVNNQGRREFIASLGILGLAGVLPFTASGTDISERIKNPAILAAGPYLQYAGPNGITVRWITLTPCVSWVEYGETPGNPDKKAESSHSGLVDAYTTLHSITLDGLVPEKKYFYRICSKSIETFEPYKVVYGETYTSSEYSFETIGPQKKGISFLVFNDIHDRPESFAHLMQFRQQEKTDFMLMNGDIFGHLDNEAQIFTNLLEPLSSTISSSPLIFSRGNHETRGIFARHLGDYFNHRHEGFYFSFIAGPAYCIVLDSGEDKPDDDPEYFGLVKFDPYRLAQRKWLKKEIEKKKFKNAKYRLVFSHIPLFYSGDWHGPTHCREIWGDILNKAKINALISGHTHVAGIHPKAEGLHNYPIVIGGGPKDGARAMIEIHAGSQSLHIKLIDDTGKMKGELVI